MRYLARVVASLALFFALNGTATAQVVVAPDILQMSPKQALSIPPLRAQIIDLGSFDVGEGVAVQVEINNAVYKDLSAYVVDAANIGLVRQNQRFAYVSGETKKAAPFHFLAKINALGPYYLVLDNRYAGVIAKQAVYQIVKAKRLTPEQVNAIKIPLTKGYAALKSEFQFKDFQIRVRSCGQSNAFSEAGGDVTLCTEIIEEMANRPGALTAVFLHELGHTLLNLWGSPSYADEDVADQFATIMLLRTGDGGKRAISEWMEWFAAQDSRRQANAMLTYGDTHSLSSQRIRNIQSNLRQSEDLARRWNNVLYPNMTDAALKRVAANPGAFEDSELATRELARRRASR